MKRFLLLFGPVLLLLTIPLIINPPHNDNTADLLEAYKAANAEAIKWDGSAKPYFITSVDDSIETKFVKGADGKRSDWNFDFVVENTNRHLIITIHNKTVVNKTETASSVNSAYIINMEAFHISTANAVTLAKENYGLLPGTNWAQGYHFVLENNGSMLILSVVGLNTDGKMSRVFFNAKTGTVIQE